MNTLRDYHRMTFANKNILTILDANGVLLANQELISLDGSVDKMKDYGLDFLLWQVENEESDAFYCHSIWKKFRQTIIQRDHYECQLCKAQGHLTVVQSYAYVHHMAELKLFPKLALNSNNLVTLCYDCHEYTHDRVAKWRETDITTFENFDAVEKW